MVALFVVSIVESWRKGDQAHAAESQQQLPVGHVLETAIWLEPLPMSAKDPGYMLSTLTPVLIDRLRPVGVAGLRPGGWPGLERYRQR